MPWWMTAARRGRFAHVFGPRFNTPNTPPPVADPNTPPPNGGGTPPPNPAAPPPPNPDLIPRAEAQAAFRSRDEAKAGLRLIATAMGIDPATIKVVANPDDAANPFKLEAPELEALKPVIEQHRQNQQSVRRRGMTLDSLEQQLNTAHQADVQARVAAFNAERDELTGLLRDQLSTPMLRAAFAAEGAVDETKDGNYEDLIALTKGRVKVDILRDDTTGGRPQVKVTPLKEDGTPLLDSNGKPATVRQLAAEFLNQRPHMRNSGFRRGPGAGGHGNTQRAGGSPANRAAGGDAAASFLFGQQGRTPAA